MEQNNSHQPQDNQQNSQPSRPQISIPPTSTIEMRSNHMETATFLIALFFLGGGVLVYALTNTWTLAVSLIGAGILFGIVLSGIASIINHQRRIIELLKDLNR